MMTPENLLVRLLLDLVDRIPDRPKRVLFRGISYLYEAFAERAATEHADWDVRITQLTSAEPKADVVGARNDPSIPVLVVFYQAEVRERESLNAFRLFNEDQITEELVAGLKNGIPGILQKYTDDDLAKLRFLLGLVYPSVERLAQLLLTDQERLGEFLPLMGLFNDPELKLSLPARQWQARLQENQEAAVLRWRDFLNKGINTKAGRDLLGKQRLADLRAAETDPSKKEGLLAAVTLIDALSVLNPPSRLVVQIMTVGFTRKQAEDLIAAVKAGQAGKAGHVSLPPFLVSTPHLPDWLEAQVSKLAPSDGDDGPTPTDDLRRVSLCLEGLLRLAGQPGFVLPDQLTIRRADAPNHSAQIALDLAGRLSVQMGGEAARSLSSADAARTGELQFEIGLAGPNQTAFRFSLAVMPEWLDDYPEDWLEDDFWARAAALNPANAAAWSELHERVCVLREIVDPDWRREAPSAEGDTSREPNNSVYAIFDLLYLANRELFDGFLDAWLTCATLPWRDNSLALKPDGWYEAVCGLLRIGTAQRVNGKRVIFPFYPLRLAWYREVFRKIEGWLTEAMCTKESLVFEPGVLSEQFKPVDRPRVLFDRKLRLLEAGMATFFISQFVLEDQHRRARPPLYRARQKLDQFGRMWPFSLDRLHLAFQPGDAGEAVYHILLQESEEKPDAAYRVQALVESTGTLTIFDRQLLGSSEETVDLLTEEHHESILPRVDYTKATLADANSVDEGLKAHVSAAHLALLVDAFSGENFEFLQSAGRLNPAREWRAFADLAQSDTPESRRDLAVIDLCALPYHTGPLKKDGRDLVYVPFSGAYPEYLRMLYDSLLAWQYCGGFQPGAYVEKVRWDASRLDRLHENADWVVLFDRTLDKSMFAALVAPDVKLIDYYANLPGGYQMSVSSKRTEAVKWQLGQVLQQFFASDEVSPLPVAERMLTSLSKFASGLLLKTLGGGSLAQELLGLYATYLSLEDDGEYVPGQDLLIPLDDYQWWFGRRTQRGQRADLLVLRNPKPDTLCLMAVESKWYKSSIGKAFVADEFGQDGQLRTTVTNLRSLFDPAQHRLDSDYWQKTLASLLDAAPPCWADFRKHFGSQQWRLEVDGIVYVHQYQAGDTVQLRANNDALLEHVASHLHFPTDESFFAFGPNARRLRMKSRGAITGLFGR